MMPRTPFEVPEQMREVADRSVDQAKKAFAQFLDATQQAVAKAEGSARSIQEGVTDVNRQAMAFVEENMAASFDLAQRLVRARTLEEIAAIQQEFAQRQMTKVAEQGKQIGEMAGRAATGAMDKAKK
ncbi:MAG: phasin family protein [Bauldia sp.]